MSPTKVEVTQHPSWNVTGKGGGEAEYRRRTVEYVDSNMRDYKQQQGNTICLLDIRYVCLFVLDILFGSYDYFPPSWPALVHSMFGISLLQCLSNCDLKNTNM